MLRALAVAVAALFQVLAMGGDGAVGTAWAMADVGADAPVGGGAAAALTHPLQTTVHCEYLGAWADVCRYKNICFSGAPFNTVFISNQPQHKKLKGKPKQQPPIHASTKLFRHIKGPPKPTRVHPVHYKVGHTEVVDPEDVAAGTVPVTWVDRVMWIPSYFERLGNIWFYSTRILPLFTMNMRRELFQLPEMQDVLIAGPEEKIKSDWHLSALRAAIPSNVNVYYRHDPPYYGFKDNSTTWCFRQAVLLGSNMYGFPDMVSAYEYRRVVYAGFGIQVISPNRPPRRVMVLDRHKALPRHFLNLDAMQAIMRKYGFEAERVEASGEMSFQQQVELFAGAGVLVTMHGAGLMNQIFMQPGSAVIEIFPVHLKHVLYERVAHYAGLYHFKVYATEFAQGVIEKQPLYNKLECDKLESLSISDNTVCWGIIKNANVITPLHDFETAFVHALDHIGVRTKINEPATSLVSVDRAWVSAQQEGEGEDLEDAAGPPADGMEE